MTATQFDPLAPLKGAPMRQPGSEIWDAYRMGEITQEEWFNFSAVEVSRKIENLAPAKFPPMHGPVRSYCVRRIDGSMSYDQVLAKSLGDWFWSTQRIFDANLERLNLLKWARGRLLPLGAGTPIAALERGIARIEGTLVPFEEINYALRTKQMDAVDRERTKRVPA